MENLVNSSAAFTTYHGKRVLVTGHTGFKGSWLSAWLLNLNASVAGLALSPTTTPNHFEALSLDMESFFIDLRDSHQVHQAVQKFRPEIVFHLAAQPLVRYSYKNPIETYEVNVLGTLHLLEACRKTDSVRSIVLATTDKCYENKEWVWGYREIDELGGHDPYSSSKACAELLISSYRRSYFPLSEYKKSHHCLIASVRAGNVIGGGDWAEERLLPDIVRATVNQKPVTIRNPKAIRPWQHVLDPLHGYLKLGAQLYHGDIQKAEAWNFGPQESAILSVKEVLSLMQKEWSEIQFTYDQKTQQMHEAQKLMLDSSKARSQIPWLPLWSIEQAISQTAKWYKTFYSKGKVLTYEQIRSYMEVCH